MFKPAIYNELTEGCQVESSNFFHVRQLLLLTNCSNLTNTDVREIGINSAKVRTAAVSCSLNAPRFGGVKLGIWLTGKLGCAWVGAWRGAWVMYLDL